MSEQKGERWPELKIRTDSSAVISYWEVGQKAAQEHYMGRKCSVGSVHAGGLGNGEYVYVLL